MRQDNSELTVAVFAGDGIGLGMFGGAAGFRPDHTVVVKREPDPNPVYDALHSHDWARRVAVDRPVHHDGLNFTGQAADAGA